jgi:ABC-type uncharacterized transport system auxiliary subunit
MSWAPAGGRPFPVGGLNNYSTRSSAVFPALQMAVGGCHENRPLDTFSLDTFRVSEVLEQQIIFYEYF